MVSTKECLVLRKNSYVLAPVSTELITLEVLIWRPCLEFFDVVDKPKEGLDFINRVWGSIVSCFMSSSIFLLIFSSSGIGTRLLVYCSINCKIQFNIIHFCKIWKWFTVLTFDSSLRTFKEIAISFPNKSLEPPFTTIHVCIRSPTRRYIRIEHTGNC